MLRHLLSCVLITAGCAGPSEPCPEPSPARETGGGEVAEVGRAAASLCEEQPSPAVHLLRPTDTQSFSSAKDDGWEIFASHQVSFYCGCAYERPDPDRAGVPDHSSCGYQLAGSYDNRADRIEWEHLVPAARMGQDRACWTQEDCVRPSTGTPLEGRDCCEATDEEFAMMLLRCRPKAPARCT